MPLYHPSSSSLPSSTAVLMMFPLLFLPPFLPSLISRLSRFASSSSLSAALLLFHQLFIFLGSASSRAAYSIHLPPSSSSSPRDALFIAFFLLFTFVFLACFRFIFHSSSPPPTSSLRFSSFSSSLLFLSCSFFFLHLRTPSSLPPFLLIFQSLSSPFPSSISHLIVKFPHHFFPLHHPTHPLPLDFIAHPLHPLLFLPSFQFIFHSFSSPFPFLIITLPSFLIFSSSSSHLLLPCSWSSSSAFPSSSPHFSITSFLVISSSSGSLLFLPCSRFIAPPLYPPLPPSFSIHFSLFLPSSSSHFVIAFPHHFLLIFLPPPPLLLFFFFAPFLRIPLFLPPFQLVFHTSSPPPP